VGEVGSGPSLSSFEFCRLGAGVVSCKFPMG
jgi:hypothetical protein